MIFDKSLKFSIFILCFLSVHMLFGQKLSMSIKSDNQSISDVFVTIVDEAGVSYMGTTDQNGRFTYQLSSPQKITISLDHLSYEKLDTTINLSQDMDINLQIIGISYELNAVSFTSS
ncbi:MAG TPA: carboxypeptidase-like regulatory domain-containing protein, partial [Saprospiraceae bacterium]|nr:carboxypeptidase-like regulatory domain-containing protein [Saprospiraceae bacterium]